MQDNENINVVYSALRDEIIHNHDAANNFFIVAMTATVVLIGVGLTNKKNWSLFLSPFAILIPAALLIEAKMHSTFRIASFLKVVVEPQMNPPIVRWETRLNYTRAACGSYVDLCWTPDLLFYLAISLGLGGLGVICAVLAFKCLDTYKCLDKARSKKQMFSCMLAIIISIGFFVRLMYSLWYSGGFSEWIRNYAQLWYIEF